MVKNSSPSSLRVLSASASPRESWQTLPPFVSVSVCRGKKFFFLLFLRVLSASASPRESWQTLPPFVSVSVVRGKKFFLLSVQALTASGSEKTPQEPASEPLAALGLYSRELRKMFFLIPLPRAPVHSVAPNNFPNRQQPPIQSPPHSYPLVRFVVKNSSSPSSLRVLSASASPRESWQLSPPFVSVRVVRGKKFLLPPLPSAPSFKPSVCGLRLRENLGKLSPVRIRSRGSW